MMEHNLRLAGFDRDKDTIRFFDSYVPAWLVGDTGFLRAMQLRLEQLMDMQDYQVLEMGDPFETDTPDAPVPPGMALVRVCAWIREFDATVSFSEGEVVDHTEVVG